MTLPAYLGFSATASRGFVETGSLAKQTKQHSHMSNLSTFLRPLHCSSPLPSFAYFQPTAFRYLQLQQQPIRPGDSNQYPSFSFSTTGTYMHHLSTETHDIIYGRQRIYLRTRRARLKVCGTTTPQAIRFINIVLCFLWCINLVQLLELLDQKSKISCVTIYNKKHHRISQIYLQTLHFLSFPLTSPLV